jgi:sugar lactone lactonase YvrE
MEKLSPKFIANSLAALVILGFCTLIGISLWISGNSRDVFGPTMLVTDRHGQVVTNIGHTLYLLNELGTVEQQVDLAALGIPDVPLSDGLVLPDGTLLLGAAGSEQIYACQLAQQHCTPFLNSSRAPVSAYKLAWDDRRQHLIVVDGARHRILTYERNGNFIAESRGGRRGLKFPNTPLITPQDELVIADTNHHRLVALDAQTLGEELWELPVKNDLGNFRRIWPTDFTRTASGNFWVILDDDLLEHGDVILFDSRHRALKRLDLPPDWVMPASVQHWQTYVPDGRPTNAGGTCGSGYASRPWDCWPALPHSWINGTGASWCRCSRMPPQPPPLPCQRHLMVSTGSGATR